MKLQISRENRTGVLLGVVLITVSACTFVSSNLQHHESREHSDMRWNGVLDHIDVLATACKIKDAR